MDRRMSDDVKDSDSDRQSDRQTGQLARDHHDLFFPVWSGAEAQQSVRASGGISLQPTPTPPHPALSHQHLPESLACRAPTDLQGEQWRAFTQ